MVTSLQVRCSRSMILINSPYALGFISVPIMVGSINFCTLIFMLVGWNRRGSVVSSYQVVPLADMWSVVVPEGCRLAGVVGFFTLE